MKTIINSVSKKKSLLIDIIHYSFIPKFTITYYEIHYIFVCYIDFLFIIINIIIFIVLYLVSMKSTIV